MVLVTRCCQGQTRTWLIHQLHLLVHFHPRFMIRHTALPMSCTWIMPPGGWSIKLHSDSTLFWGRAFAAGPIGHMLRSPALVQHHRRRRAPPSSLGRRLQATDQSFLSALPNPRRQVVSNAVSVETSSTGCLYAYTVHCNTRQSASDNGPESAPCRAASAARGVPCQAVIDTELVRLRLGEGL